MEQKIEQLGNTQSCSKIRKIAFSFFDWTPEIIRNMEQDWINHKYIFEEEICPETKRPHLQGWINHVNPVSFSAFIKKWKGIHVKEQYAKAKDYHNIGYCSKDHFRCGNNLYTNLDIKYVKECYDKYNAEQELKEKTKHKGKLQDILKQKALDLLSKKLEEPYEWQKDILSLIEEEPNDRTIHWYWSSEGAKGKSTLANYIILKYNGLSIPSKASDAYHAIIKAITEQDIEPKIIIIDVPRSSLGYLNYQAIENIKNGLITSGKYEGGMVAYPPPHVIVFANEEPDKEKMSNDRWKIVCID